MRSLLVLVAAAVVALGLFVCSLLSGEKRLHTLANMFADVVEGRYAHNLMLGSSTMRKLDPALIGDCGRFSNRGIGRAGIDTISNYLRMPFKRWSTNSILLYAGDNDVARDGLDAVETTQRYQGLVDRLLIDYPQSTLLLLEIKPSPKRLNYHQEYRKINSSMEHYARKNQRVFFIETGWDDVLLSGREVFQDDGVHLNALGNKIMASHIGETCKTR